MPCGPGRLLLHAVSAGHRYGFDIIDATGLPSGTVYPALGRLEDADFVRSGWEDARVAQEEKRPPRRYYTMTATGNAALADADRLDHLFLVRRQSLQLGIEHAEVVDQTELGDAQGGQHLIPRWTGAGWRPTGACDAWRGRSRCGGT